MQERIYGLTICHNRVILRKQKDKYSRMKNLYLQIKGGGRYVYINRYLNVCNWFNYSRMWWRFSGLEVIGKFVGGAVLVLAIMWLFTQPVLLIIVIALIVIIAMCCAGSSK